MKVWPLSRYHTHDASTRAPVDAPLTARPDAQPGAGTGSEAPAGSVLIPVAEQIAQADAETEQLIDAQRYGNVDHPWSTRWVDR